MADFILLCNKARLLRPHIDTDADRVTDRGQSRVSLTGRHLAAVYAYSDLERLLRLVWDPERLCSGLDFEGHVGHLGGVSRFVPLR